MTTRSQMGASQLKKHLLEVDLSIADTIWLATALLHEAHPDALGFDHETILRKVADLDPSLNPRSVSTHLSTHCVASKKANPATLRILSEDPDGSLRLFRAGDSFHPTRRTGRTAPKPHVLPQQYKHLLQSYAAGPFSHRAISPAEDPILAISGVGKEMWKRLGGGEKFVGALREEIFPADLSAKGKQATFDRVWDRIKLHIGQEFRTKREEPFSYDVQGNIVIPRPHNGEQTKRRLPRSDFEKAWNRRPLFGPGQIHDLQGPSYIYGILSDARISAS
ncbi:MAG: hypothetical protein JWO19_1477 [Bryobacterales bacterium]|nr:hypothetical protein [Bryobacterales bacterium]